MLSAINHTLGSVQFPPLQQDGAEPQRRKRSTDATDLNAADPDRTTNNGRRRSGSGLDSLGQGRLL